MEIRGQLVKVLSFYKMAPGAMLGSQGLVPSPSGPSHSSLFVLSQCCEQSHNQDKYRRVDLHLQSQGLRVYCGREAWEQAAGIAARAQAKSHILSDKHEHTEQLKRGEASHSRSLPPWHSSSDNWRLNAQLRETVQDTLKSPHAAPKFCLSLQTVSLFD